MERGKAIGSLWHPPLYAVSKSLEHWSRCVTVPLASARQLPCLISKNFNIFLRWSICPDAHGCLLRGCGGTWTGATAGLGSAEMIMQREIKVARGQISVCSEKERFTVTSNLSIN